MSIKRSLVEKLRREFLYNSPDFKDFGDKIEKYKLEIKNIIEEYSISLIPNDEFNVLKHLLNFWFTIRVHPGITLRNIIGGRHFNPELERYYENSYCYYFGIDIKVTKPYYDKYKEGISYNLKFPEDIIPEIIEINDKILDIEYTKSQLECSFNKLINVNTKKRWLRLNFPKIYDRLKEYENNKSI